MKKLGVIKKMGVMKKVIWPSLGVASLPTREKGVWGITAAQL